jgi:hypothetical protein
MFSDIGLWHKKFLVVTVGESHDVSEENAWQNCFLNMAVLAGGCILGSNDTMQHIYCLQMIE